MGRQAAISGIGMIAGLATGGVLSGFAAGWGWTATSVRMMMGVGFTLGSFGTSLLFAASQDTDMPDVSTYPIQSSSYGAITNISYGSNRIAGNVVWMSDVTTYDIEPDGDKGGSDGESTGYRRSFVIQVCEGPRHITKIWADDEEISMTDNYSYAGETASIKNPDSVFKSAYSREITVFQGQGNDGLQDLIGENLAAYKYDCCVYFDNYDLGYTDRLPNFTFQVNEVNIQWSDGLALEGATRIYSLLELGETGIVLAGSYLNNRIHRSTDYGRTFPTYTDLTEGNRVYRMACDETGQYVVVSQDDGYIAYSDDYGETFSYNQLYSSSSASETIPSYLGNGVFVVGLTFTPTTLTRIYRSTDYGASFSYVQSVNSMEPHQIIYIEETLVSSTALMVGYPDGTIFRSSNRGASWSLNTTLDGETAILAAVYLGDGVILLGTQSGHVWRTTTGTPTELEEIFDGHKAFNPEWTDIGQLGSAGNVYSFAYMGVGRVLAGTDDGLYESFDYGVTWTYKEDLESESDIYSMTTLSNDAVLAGTGSGGKVFDSSHGDDRWILDINPGKIMLDLMKSTRYGAGMPASYINEESFQTEIDHWYSIGMALSFALTSQRSVLEWISHILSHCHGFIYRQGNQLYCGSWRDEEPLGHITRDDLSVDESGNSVPVTISERKYSESINTLKVQWTNREDSDASAMAEATDDVDIRVSGQRRIQTVNLSGIKRQDVAELEKWRYLIDSLYRMNSYAFRLGPKHQDIKGGKCYLLTDGFMVSNQKIRITKIMESERANEIEVEAIDDISNLYPDLDGWNTTSVNQRTADAVITSSDLVEPTVAFREDWESKVIHLSIAPQTAYTQGFAIFVSRDDVSYEYLGKVALAGITSGLANVSGETLSDLNSAKEVTWRGDETLLVDVGTVGDLATDITDAQFFGNLRPAKIGNEIVAYRTCEETETEGQWLITGLIRGLWQTTPESHDTGATFATLNIDFDYEYRDSDIGGTLYFKCAPFYRTVSMNIASVTARSHVVKGHINRPLSPSLVRIQSDEIANVPDDTDYSGATFDLYWNLPSRTTGFNQGPRDGGDTWVWGDDESDLVAQNGVAYGAYTADERLEAIDLVFRQEDDTLITQRSIAVASSETITKATDLGGYNPAQIEVWPRYALRSIREESITVDDGS